MTRRGTLAYYLAAWVIGGLVVSFSQWVGEAFAGEIHTASFLLTTYFFSLAFGAVAILPFAFLLRRSMRLLSTHVPWAWFLSGGVLAWLQTLVLIQAQSFFLTILSGKSGETLFAALLMEADSLFGRNIWKVLVDGAVTALVLCLVDRAFASPRQAAEARHSPA